MRRSTGRRAQFAATVSALGLTLASTGLAAPPTSSAPATAPPKPAASAPAKPAATAPPANDASEEASQHFKRGLQLFDEGDYTLALVEFGRAYQLAPNYRALYNIALVNMQLGRYADAERTFEQYLKDGGDGVPPTRRAEVNKTLGELKFRTATVEISSNVAGAEITLDGKPLDPSRLHGAMEIDAGEHTLRATAPGYQAANRTMTLAGGDRAAVRLNLTAILTRTGPETPVAHGRPVFWPGFVATGALAAGAIVSGAVMLDSRSRLSQLESTPSDPNSAAAAATQRQNAANQANSAALVADILTGLAVVTGGVSLYLSLAPDHPSKPTAAALVISPSKVSLSMPF